MNFDYLFAGSPVIVDTDMGHDDVMAIAMLVAAHAHIIGITTVNGLCHVHQGTENVLRILDRVGSGEIPVAIGADGGGSIRMTAVATTCLQFLGKDRNDPQVMATANQIIKDGLPAAGALDFYRWYYASLGLFQMGVKSEVWKQWNEPLKTSLLASQCKEGTFKENKGSWDPDAEISHAKGKWGRVGQTALGALMLEVYYRYDDCHKNPVVNKPKK